MGRPPMVDDAGTRAEVEQLRRLVVVALPTFDADDESWRDGALCRGMDGALFFPPSASWSRWSEGAGLGVCRRCPVRVECLTFALVTGERHGIWGGTSERSRRRLAHLVKL